MHAKEDQEIISPATSSLYNPHKKHITKAHLLGVKLDLKKLGRSGLAGQTKQMRKQKLSFVSWAGFIGPISRIVTPATYCVAGAGAGPAQPQFTRDSPRRACATTSTAII